MQLKLLTSILLFFTATIIYAQVANQANDLIACDDLGSNDGFAMFNLTVNTQIILGSQSPSDFSISYHISQTNATAGINAITNENSYANTSNPQTIYARITENGSGNFDTTSFEIEVAPLPILNQPSLVQLCDVGNDGIEIVDLTQVIPEILNGQTPNGLSIEFYNSGLFIADPSNFMNSTNPSTFEVYVTDLQTGCLSVTFFDLILHPVPEPTQPTPLMVCDPDGDGFADFDLESKISEIINGMQNLIVSFHESQVDAQNNTNTLTSPYSNVTSVTQTIYVRVDDGFNGCSAIVTLELQAIDCSDFGQIVVNAYFDENGNTVFDANEMNFSNGYFTYEINNNGITNSASSSTGQFIIFSENDTDSYDITFNLYSDGQNCYTLPLASFDNITVNTGNSVDVEFAVLAAESCQDLGVYLYNPSASPRPGFNYTNQISLQNFGNETIASGTVEFIYDEVLQFNQVTSINPNYTVTSIAGGISIDFVDLLPNDIENISISLYCPTNTTLGTVVVNSVTYINTGSDNNETNNMSTLSQVVIGSYDPNDIIESHGPKVVYDDFTASDEYLYYLIRFQNVGTAEAINIRIEDVLYTQLDTNTFKMLHSSHDNVVTLLNNELIWQFDNINLPSESMDAEDSNGFVYFKIKPQIGYAIGDIIPNVADIYFDFNAAITTNVFTTEFVQALSVDDFEFSNFKMFPNPANSSVTFQFDSLLTGSISILNIQGKTILSESISNKNRFQFNVTDFESGLYFVKLNTRLNETVKKLIIN